MTETQDSFPQDQPTSSGVTENTDHQENANGNPATDVAVPNPTRFTKFTMLPAEIRVQIYREAAFEAMNSIQTMGTHRGYGNEDDVFVVHTRRRQSSFGGLLQACRESREEAKRFCVLLPARLVTDAGVVLINMAHGRNVRPVTSHSVGDRLYHCESTFYMDEMMAVKTFNSLYANHQTVGQLDWLRNLMLDRRTFLHLLSGHHSFARSRPGAPFTALPNLRRIVVGFAYRFQDVAIVEGKYADVVTEVEVRKVLRKDGEQALYCAAPLEIHFMIQLMITNTARQTTEELADLESAGIEVVWAVIKGEEAFTRRTDVLAGIFGLLRIPAIG